MAILDDNDRSLVHTSIMRDLSARRDPISITKADLRAAVNALDNYLNSNAASINTAIPQPARSNLTSSQKALILMYVIEKRYVTGA